MLDGHTHIWIIISALSAVSIFLFWRLRHLGESPHKLLISLRLIGLNTALAAVITVLNWETEVKLDISEIYHSEQPALITLETQQAHLEKPDIPEPDPEPVKEEKKILQNQMIEIDDSPELIETELKSHEIEDLPAVAAVSDPTPPVPPAPSPLPTEEEPEEIVLRAQQMPRFPVCEDLAFAQRAACSEEKLLEFMYQHIDYPPIARSNGIQGHVVGEFVVDRDGRIKDIVILRDIGGGCGAEVLGALAKLRDLDEPWIPGFNGSRPVSVRLRVPIKFTLE